MVSFIPFALSLALSFRSTLDSDACGLIVALKLCDRDLPAHLLARFARPDPTQNQIPSGSTILINILCVLVLSQGATRSRS
jgi:hypothetical protein